jgi:hypothetical protein
MGITRTEGARWAVTTLVTFDTIDRKTKTPAERIVRQRGGMKLLRHTPSALPIDALLSDSARMIRNQSPVTRVHHAQVRFS